ncbi:MAG TPA: FkbM family methyltransferase [Candidatus Dormibacteraeota bacterium]|nr:FkbM family methyltransferase [Candidatus Dormibacteraeota bacterium]
MTTAVASPDANTYDRARGGGVRELLRAYVGELRNWKTVGMLVAVTHASPLPPRRGMLFHPLRAMPITMRSRSGLRIGCRLDEASPFVEIFVRGEYDVPGLDWASMRTIVDVGANVGMATMWMAQHAPEARFVAVEPAPSTARRLRANLDRNGLGDRVDVVVAGVASQRGRGSMVFDAGFSSHAFVEQSNAGEIELCTLDDVFDRTGEETVDLLKIDCEGGEYDILQGAVLRRARAIVGEYHVIPGHHPEELSDRLRAAGFRVWMEPVVRNVGRFHAFRVAE